MPLNEMERRLLEAYGVSAKEDYPLTSQPYGRGPFTGAAPGFTAPEANLLRSFGVDPLAPQAPATPEYEPGMLSEFGRGVKAGVRQLGVDARALGAVGSAVFGAEETANELGALAQAAEEDIQRDLPRAVEFSEMLDSPSNFALYAARVLGEQIPVIASILLGGGVGTIVGKLLARGAIKSGAARLAVQRFAGPAGALTAATGIETGATASETYGATGEMHPGLSIAAGIAKGSLETLTPLAFTRMFGLFGGASTGLLSRITSNLASIQSRPGRALLTASTLSPVEAATELLQESVDTGVRDFVDENYDALSPENRERLLEAATTGAIVAFILGGVGGAISPTPPPREGEGEGGEGERLALPPPTRLLPPPAARGPAIRTPGPEGEGGPAIPMPGPTVRPEGEIPPERLFTPEGEFVSVSSRYTPGEADQFPGETIPHTFLAEDSQPGEGVTYGIRYLRPMDQADEQGALEIVEEAGEGFFSPEQMDVNDVTTDIMDMPTQPEELNRAGFVDFLNMDKAKEALSLAKEAIRLRNEAIASWHRENKDWRTAPRGGITVANSEQLSKALSKLMKAVELGFRMRPVGKQGFIHIGTTEKGISPRDSVMRKVGEEVTAVTQPSTIEVGGTVGDMAIEPAFIVRGVAGEVRDGVLTLSDSVAGNVFMGNSTAPGQPNFGIGVTLEDAQTLENIHAVNTPRLHAFATLYSIERERLGRDLTIDEFLSFVEKEGAKRGIAFRRGAFQALDKDSAKLKDFQAALLRYFKNDIRTNEMELTDRGLRVIPRSNDSTVTAIGGIPANKLRRFSTVPTRRRFPTRPARRSPHIHFKLDPNSMYWSDATIKEKADGVKYRIYKNGKVSSATVAEGENLETKLKDKVTVIIHPGVVERVKNRKELRSNLGRVKRTYEKLMGMGFVASDTKLVVIVGEAFNNPSVRGVAYYRPANGPLQLIGFSVDKLNRSPGDVLSTAAHEFGHLIGFTTLMREDFSVVQKIFSAYHRHLLRREASTTREFEFRFASLDRLRKAPDWIGSPDYNSPIIDFRNPAARTYWLSFSEWFAEQTTRWVESSDTARDVVEGFFKGLAQKFRRLAETVFAAVFPNTKFKANEVVAEYLESLVRSGVLPTATATSASTSFEDNAIADEDQYAPTRGFTAQPQSHNIKKLLKRLGIKDTDTIPKEIDKFGFIAKWGWNILQLADQNKHIPGLQRYVEVVEKWYNLKMAWISRADERVGKWKWLPPKQREALAQVLYELDAMTYLSPSEHERGVLRQPTAEELIDIKKRHGLEKDGEAMLQMVQQDFVDALEQIKASSAKSIRAQYGADTIVAEVEIARMNAEIDALKKRPYFPHMRFGKYSVIIKKEGKTEHMETFAYQYQANDFAKQMRSEFPSNEGYIIRLDKIPESVQPFRGLPASLLAQIRSRLQLTEEQKAWLDELLVEMNPARSFKKRMLRRNDVPGFSTDAMRVYASYFFTAANFFARIEYEPDMTSIISEMKKEISEATDPMQVVRKRRDIISFMEDHKNQILNPVKDWAQLRSAAFMWWLGFSPASAALNLTQVPLVAAPYLAARYNDSKAIAALKNAILDVRKMYGKGKLPEADAKLLDLALQQGFIDESQATELAATAEGDNLQRLLPGTKAQRFLMNVNHWSAYMFQASEKMNRRIVFRAAVELARRNPDATYLRELREQNRLQFRDLVTKEGMSEGEAIAFLAGKDAVRRTQFEYASWSRPRFMRGRKGVLFTFFMFTQNTVYFARHSPGRTRYLLMMLLAAGMMGLPFAEDLTAFVKFAARNLLGKDVDLEKELREIIVEMTDGTLPPDLILHGSSRYGFGLPHAFDLIGIPFPSFDMSANIGMGQIIPGVAELGPPGLEFEERLARVSTDVAGASFGIGLNLLKFMSDDTLPLTDAKRFERAMPRAFRNMTRAIRFYTEERERTRSGATVVEFDRQDPDHLAEIAALAAGFNPTRLSQRWDREAMQREVLKFWEIRKRMVMSQIDHAYYTREPSAARDMQAAVRRFNNEVPYPQMRIRRDALRRSRRERRRQRRLYELGFPTQRNQRYAARQVQQLFPETLPDKDEAPTDAEDATRWR